MAWFDLITRGLGQTNPYDEASQWADTQQAQNRRAIGLDANGNPLPPPAATAAQDPNDPNSQAAQSAAAGQAMATGVQQPQQEPAATKTPPSLGHIMMDLQQYEQREQGFNQAMGAGFAAFSQPRDREWVSKIFNVNEPDPTRIGETLMNMQTQQSGVDRGNAMGQMINGPQGAALAQQLNISQAELRARYLADPQGVGTMIQNMATPTEASKNYQQARAIMKQQGMTDEQINAVMPPEMLALGGISDPGYREFVLARTRAIQSDQPLPPELQDYPTYQASKAAKAKLMGDQANDLAESQKQFAPAITKMTEVGNLTSSIQSATEADGKTSVLQSILNDPRKKAAAAGLLGAEQPGGVGSLLQQGGSWLADLTPEEQTVIANLKQLTASQYATAFTSTGSRRTQSEVQNIAASLSQLGNLNQPYDSYSTALSHLRNLNQAGMANTYGAAGRLDDVPDNLKPLVNSIYLAEQRDEKGNVIRPRGPLYTGAGGDWATRPLQTQPTQSAPQPLAQGGGGGGGAVDLSGMSETDANTAYDRLPSGAVFIGPDGKRRRKP